jgi:hypothetical protein
VGDALTNLHNALPSLDHRDQALIQGAKRVQQSAVAAIPQQHPSQSSAINRSIGEKNEILIFTHKDSIFRDALIPYRVIGSLIEMQIGDVPTIMAESSQMGCQRLRELMIDEKLHAVLRTT